MLSVRGVRTLSGDVRDIWIDNGRLVEGPVDGEVLDGKGLLAVPGLCNTHTHAAMTLLRGIGEGLELDRWLSEAIWPLEGRMKAWHVEAGMRLACLEMIMTGTTCFNDMYFMEGRMAPIVREMGLRAVLGEGLLDHFDPERLASEKARIRSVNDEIKAEGGGLVTTAAAPHAVYTVSREGLLWAEEEAERIGGTYHVHACETAGEVSDWTSRTGTGPVGYLDSLGVLNERTLMAHAVHLSDEDIDILARRGASVSFNAVSNMKLSSGGPMRFNDLRRAGVRVTIGTDGPASNNSLDMFQAMKVSALMVKNACGASSVLPSEILDCATRQGYLALGIDGGTLEPGSVADMVLLDLDHPSMVPGHDLASNLVYSVSPTAVRHTIVGGRVLMRDHVVEGAGDIIRKAREAAADLVEGV